MVCFHYNVCLASLGFFMIFYDNDIVWVDLVLGLFRQFVMAFFISFEIRWIFFTILLFLWYGLLFRCVTQLFLLLFCNRILFALSKCIRDLSFVLFTLCSGIWDNFMLSSSERVFLKYIEALGFPSLHYFFCISTFCIVPLVLKL